MSVDSNLSLDNGYLRNAQDFLRSTQGSVQIHGTTAEAAAHLPAGQDVNIVGHGGAGWIVTGTGQSAFDPKRFVGLSNETTWQPEVKGRGWKSLRLWSCQTGCGLSGRVFLKELAAKTNAECHALTGDLVCNAKTGFALIGGATWVTAKPDQSFEGGRCSRAPVPDANRSLKFRVDGKPVEIERSGVKRLAWITATFAGARFNADGAPVRFDLPETLIDAFDFTEPVDFGGAPAGVQTGTLTVEFPANATSISKDFAVYNQSLLWDIAEGLYYPGTSALSTLMATLPWLSRPAE